MCWFSVATSEQQVVQARVGQNLAIKMQIYSSTFHRAANWVVRASQLDSKNPCPVCLPDGATLVFSNLPKEFRERYGLPEEAEATFRMKGKAKKRVDIFEFDGGARISLGHLRHGFRFSVLSVPGVDPLSPEDQDAVKALHQEALVRVRR